MFSVKANFRTEFELPDDYIVIPLGRRCASAIACKMANLRKASYPFDWVQPALPKIIQSVLENNFDGFLPNFQNGNITNRYSIEFTHFNPDINKGIGEYERRITRFMDVLKGKTKLYFVFINEDYLYDKKERDGKRTADIFSDMIDLEKYLKQQFQNINMDIIYFDFVEHITPSNSNIYCVKIDTMTVFDNYHSISTENLRIYCGSFLSTLFKTKLTINGQESDDSFIVNENI